MADTGPMPVFTDPFAPSSTRRTSQAAKRLSQNSYCWDRSSFDLDNDETEKVPVSTSRSNLPPKDTGHRAWTVLMAGFAIQALLMSIPSAFGCFQEYYLNSPEYKNDTRVVMIGTLAISIPDLGAPLITWFVARYPRHRIAMMWPGWMLCIGALVAASYAPNMEVLIVTQGLMFGLGHLLVFYPMLSLISEWWDVKLGLAYGILDCSWGFSGAPLPFLLTWLLNQYGPQRTLRILAIACGVATLPALILIRGRIPRSHLSSKPIKQSYAFTRNPLFYIYILATFFQGLGYFTPCLYLPTYISDLSIIIIPSSETGLPGLEKATRSTSDLLLALLAVTSIPSALLLGHLSDRNNLISLPLLSVLSASGATLTVALLWGYVRNAYALIPFAILFSLFTSGWEVLWGRMSLAVVPVNVNDLSINEKEALPSPTSSSSPDEQTSSTPMLVYALLCLSRGLSCLLTGGLGTKLLSLSPSTAPQQFGAGKYLPLITYTTVGLGLATLIVAAWWILPSRVTRRYDAVLATEEEVVVIDAGGRIHVQGRSRAATLGGEWGVRVRRIGSGHMEDQEEKGDEEGVREMRVVSPKPVVSPDMEGGLRIVSPRPVVSPDMEGGSEWR